METVTRELSIERKWWNEPALTCLSVLCALVSFVSFRAADWIGDVGTELLARWYWRYRIDG